MTRPAPLQNRCAVVTGAAQGIGEAYARCLVALGARVVVADIDLAGAERVASDLCESGLECWAHEVDVTDEQSCHALHDAILEREPSRALNVLVNNAGLYRGLESSTITDMSMARWRQIVDVNLTGVLAMTRAMLPLLRAGGTASVINQSSAGAFLLSPGSLAYCVSKSAVNALTQGLAKELGHAGIRVNAIAPGVTMSPASVERYDQPRLDAAIAATALGKVGAVEDLAGVLEFLATDASAWMTGQIVIVDGGRSFVR